MTGSPVPLEPKTWVPVVGDTVWVWCEGMADPRVVVEARIDPSDAYLCELDVRTAASDKRGTIHTISLGFAHKTRVECLRVELKMALLTLDEATTHRRHCFRDVERIEQQLRIAIQETYLSPKGTEP